MLILTGVTLACLTGCATRSNAPLPTLLPNLTQPCDPFQPPPLATNSDVGRAYLAAIHLGHRLPPATH